jgi:hypothetical protein
MLWKVSLTADKPERHRLIEIDIHVQTMYNLITMRAVTKRSTSPNGRVRKDFTWHKNFN